MEIPTPLKLLDLFAQRGLSEMKTISRSPEMQFFGHGDEVFQMTEFHRIIIAKSC